MVLYLSLVLGHIDLFWLCSGNEQYISVDGRNSKLEKLGSQLCPNLWRCEEANAQMIYSIF